MLRHVGDGRRHRRALWTSVANRDGTALMGPGLTIGILWVGFVASWLAAAFWRNKTEKRAGVRAELSHRLVLLIGAVLLVVPALGNFGPLRLWVVTPIEAWICVGLVAAGFAWSWWARLHLGVLWSGHITKKADHRVIDTGPYAIVRHPIYTGILFAVFATAAAKGTAPGFAGAFFITLSLWMKAQLEERWLGQDLERQAYEAYRRRVPMLLPFGPKGD
jgi:protein-S-isoprenylcysteine O-methyltransferase Ste14